MGKSGKSTKRQVPQTKAQAAVLNEASEMRQVWQSLANGYCPSCCKYQGVDIVRSHCAIACQTCGFYVMYDEIDAIERMFAPAMHSALNVFLEWRTR